MFGRDARVPELIPQLSRGKHRSPRKGACFMEMASYLAGERWSDHPACTHPLLATLARLVNDHTTDAGRGELIELVPSVIGLTSDDPHVDVQVTLRAATTALPVASAERQRVLAVKFDEAKARGDQPYAIALAAAVHNYERIMELQPDTHQADDVLARAGDLHDDAGSWIPS
jgi:hypothetical protein